MASEPSKLPRPLTPAEVLDYESWMYAETRQLLMTTSGAGWDIAHRNAIVESAALHARVLTDALLDKGSHQDDVHLRDLIPDANRPAGLSAAIERLRQAFGDGSAEGTPCWHLNKRIMHSTKRRELTFDFHAAVFSVLDHRLYDVLDALDAALGTTLSVNFGVMPLMLGTPAATSWVHPTVRSLEKLLDQPPSEQAPEGQTH